MRAKSVEWLEWLEWMEGRAIAESGHVDYTIAPKQVLAGTQPPTVGRGNRNRNRNW